MNVFPCDARALVKRYIPEAGTPVVNHLFDPLPRHRLLCLMLGAAEVMATLVRKRNANLLTPVMFAQAVAQFRNEVLGALDFAKLSSENALIERAFVLLEKYAINSTDGIVLQASLVAAAQLRTVGDDLVLVASDRRLLKAARMEGMLTFDPETQTQIDLDVLVGP
jgi:predicted nucleic acid-binding protein